MILNLRLSFQKTSVKTCKKKIIVKKKIQFMKSGPGITDMSAAPAEYIFEPYI